MIFKLTFRDTQSRTCQRKDWKNHKNDCSTLPVGKLSWPVSADVEQAEELEKEVRRVASILGAWSKAYKRYSADKARKVSQMPENQLISGTLSSSYLPCLRIHHVKLPQT